MLPKRLLVLRACLFLSFMLLSCVMWAQEKTITGKITDSKDGSPLAGVSVTAKGKSGGTTTDATGAFRISVPAATTTLVLSYVGFVSQEVNINAGGAVNVSMVATTANLNEVVVIGYGTARKKDLTGSIATVTSKDFVKGPITTPEQLIAGKVAGVQVTSNSGMPGVGSRIRIRGGTSLNASNDPLIVIDGVPLDNGSINGAPNPLSLINPNDIESFNVLKDASAAAIYGSRAANGVIIITTKKGKKGDKVRVSFSTLNSISVPIKDVDVLNAEEFTQLVNEKGTQADIDRLGEANTNWQDEIYRTAFSTDNNISMTGGLGELPYRFSLGYLNQDGILKSSNLQRTSVGLNLSPQLLDNHLTVTANLKYSYSKNVFANQAAIGTALSFDPTQPVYSGKPEYGGYWEWTNPSGLNGLAPDNPVGLLNQRDDRSNVNRFIGNVQLDYKLHFFPDLRANLNIGGDFSKGEGTIFVPAEASSDFTRHGINNKYEQTKQNKLLEFYLNYVKDIKSIQSRIDVTAGYSWQDWITKSPAFPDFEADGVTMQKPAGNPFETQNTLVSFYGRLNYNLMDRYLLTFTIRRDGSSRFSEDSRWGNFPSAAFAWKISDENFMRNVDWISNMKLRLGWGITGQQDGIADYGYLPAYFFSDSAARYQLGNGYVTLARPQGFDANLKWEETETKNIGLDVGVLNNKLNFSIDYYQKETSDLLAVVPTAAGTNFTNQILTNVGSISNKGLEFSINANPIDRGDFNLDLGFNITYIIENEITRLQLVQDPNFLGAETGDAGFNALQIHSVGHRPSTFFLYQQVYEKNGKPIEGLYNDRNRDGIINAFDKDWVKNPDPNVFMGFSANASYQKWGAGFVMRANTGNYMYNAVRANNAIVQNVITGQGYANNAPSNILETGFFNRQTWSDYYLENASFLRMDNLYVNYNFGRVINNKANLRLNFNIQNVFVITKYSGLDPEINGGIDNTIFPRPRMFAIGANLDF